MGRQRKPPENVTLPFQVSVYVPLESFLRFSAYACSNRILHYPFYPWTRWLNTQIGIYEDAVARHKQAQEQREKAAALAAEIAAQNQDEDPGSPIKNQSDDEGGANDQMRLDASGLASGEEEEKKEEEDEEEEEEEEEDEEEEEEVDEDTEEDDVEQKKEVEDEGEGEEAVGKKNTEKKPQPAHFKDLTDEEEALL